MRNSVKKKLKEDKVVVGSWMSILNEDVSRIVAKSGMDWILYDTEHGPPSFETIDRLVHAVSGLEALPLVRVVWNDINAIKQALDTGAYGVVIPWINSKEEAKNAVTYCKYPPEGLRGCAPGRAASAWNITVEEYIKTVNDEILVIVQIETKKAIDNIEDILTVEGIDATFIGPMDLSMSMGYRGQPYHPEIIKAEEKVLEACRSSGVAPGIAFGRSIDHLNELIEKGFKFIGIGSDTEFLQRGCRETLNKIKK